jgi:erythromycin esterase-like protein
MSNGQMTGGLLARDVPPAPEGSGDAILSAAAMPLFFLDMSTLPAGPLGRWLGESHLYYNVGAVWQTASAESNLSPEALSKSYDGLIFVEEGHAARGLEAPR